MTGAVFLVNVTAVSDDVLSLLDLFFDLFVHNTQTVRAITTQISRPSTLPTDIPIMAGVLKAEFSNEEIGVSINKCRTIFSKLQKLAY